MKRVPALLLLAAVIVGLAGCDDNQARQTTRRNPAAGADRSAAPAPAARQPATPTDIAARATTPESASDAAPATDAHAPTEPAITPDEQAGRNLTKARQDLADIAQGAKSLEALLLSATVEGVDNADTQADRPEQSPPAGHETEAKEATDDHRQ